MPPTFLTVPFKQKDEVKSLGARWDGAERQWFVPEGRDLAPFQAWLLRIMDGITLEKWRFRHSPSVGVNSACFDRHRLAPPGITVASHERSRTPPPDPGDAASTQP